MRPETENLGKIAYEAYCATTGWKSAITGADLPPFETTPETVQRGWDAAAKAVVAQFGDVVERYVALVLKDAKGTIGLGPK